VKVNAGWAAYARGRELQRGFARRRRLSLASKEELAAYLFILPSLAGFIVFLVVLKPSFAAT